MPSLQVRDMPENLYYLLQQRAKAAHRSLAQEAIVALTKGMNASGSHQQRREQLLDVISSTPDFPVTAPPFDPVALIREDRDR